MLILPFEDKTLPAFEARWDGGSREKLKEKSALDVDIIRGTPGAPSDEEINKWRGEKGNYSGHHSTEIPTAGGHAYEVRIATPTQGCIFEGVVSFALRRKLEVPGINPDRGERQQGGGEVDLSGFASGREPDHAGYSSEDLDAIQPAGRRPHQWVDRDFANDPYRRDLSAHPGFGEGPQSTEDRGRDARY